MVKRAKRGSSIRKQQTWHMQVGVGLVLLALAYGFGSWALDSGRLMVYALMFVSLYFGISYFARGIRQSFTR